MSTNPRVSPPSSGWWSDFFSGVVVDTLCRIFSPEQSRLEADFVERQLGEKRRPGARILDVPCGDARVAVELARRGYSMTGVDLSAETLERARARVAEAAVSVSLVHADMRDLPRDASYDAAYCFGNSFPYMDDAGNRAFLEAARRSLRPDGVFALDTGCCAESILASPLGRAWHDLGDILLLRSTSYDADAGRLTTEYVFLTTADGRLVRRTATYAVYTLRELKRLFEDAGFAGVVASSSLAGEPYRLGSPRLILVARAPSADR